MAKKIVLMAFALVLFLCLASCGDASGGKDNPEAEKTANEGIAENAEEGGPNLPEKDMGGKKFNIITAGWYGYRPLEIDDLAPEEITGDALDDAAYNRKIKIEDMYNCQIAHIQESDHVKAVDNIRKSVMAQDEAYDVAFVRGLNISSLISSGCLLDLSFLPHADFEKPWWRKSVYDSLVLNGRRFAASGNMSIGEMKAVFLVCFDKQLIQDNGLESPYALVKSGDWTFEKMCVMAKSVTRDLDGDGKMGGDDQWGIIFQNDSPPSLFGACGMKFAELDESGIPKMTLDSEANIEKLMKMHELLDIENVSQMDQFISLTRRPLFEINAVHLVNALRERDESFGIVPLPKYDRAQPEYIPMTSGTFTPLICIPKTNADTENTGLFMEIMAYEGSRSVVPAFYENILREKTARDDESQDMLDYIFGNIKYDIGTLLNFGRLVDESIVYFRGKNNTNFVSFFEKYRPVVERDINKLLDESLNN